MTVPIDIVAHHLPLAEGSAAGRALYAAVRGFQELGHDVRVTTWAFTELDVAVPAWCEVLVVPPESRWRTRARALVRPRSDAGRAGFAPRAGALVIADEPVSWAAAAPYGGAVLVHYSERLDQQATGRRDAAFVQDLRGEVRAVREAHPALALSDRVGMVVGADAVVPVATMIPEAIPPIPDAPTAGLLANWDWRPNRLAVAGLLAAWPRVRAQVPTARLVLAGRGRLSVGTLPGVSVLGQVEHATDLLEQVSTIVFPCPPSSGPKVKSLESLVYGRALVTTEAGVEGLDVGSGDAVVLTHGDLADAVAGLLADPAAAATLGARGRAAVSRAHAPRPAAARRLAAWSEAVGTG